MATKSQHIKVGLFLLICIGIMVGALGYIAGMIEEKGTLYTIEFDESIMGLYEGGMVLFKGVPVGKVKSIRVLSDSQNAHAEILVDTSKVTLHDGVTAQLSLYSIAAGTMAISLEGGESDAPILPNKAMIPTRTSILGGLGDNVDGLMEQVTTIMNSVSIGLEGMEEGDLTKVVNNVNVLLEDAAVFMDDTKSVVNEAEITLKDLRGEVQRVIDEFMEISDEVKPLIKNMDEFVITANGKLEEFDVNETTKELNRVMANIADLTETLNGAMKDFDALSGSALHEADNIQHSLNRALEELSEALDTMRSFVDQISLDPAQLIRGKGEYAAP